MASSCTRSAVATGVDIGAVYPDLCVRLQSDDDDDVELEEEYVDAGETPLDLLEHGNKDGATLKSIKRDNSPTDVDCPRAPVRYQHACSRNSNPCLNTCLRLNHRWQPCLKCDMHFFVLFIFSWLRVSEIIWEPIPADEKDVKGNDDDDDDDEVEDDDDDDDDEEEERLRLCGSDFWWKYVENKSTGDLWAVRVIVIFLGELRRNILEAWEEVVAEEEVVEEWGQEGDEDEWEDVEEE